MPHPTLILFARPPAPGQVKTRLARSLGPDRALRVYTAMLACLLDRLEPLLTEIDIQVWLASPDPASVLTSLLAGRYRTFLQEGSDLGDRMDHALSSALDAGNRPVAIIGTDSPDLPLDHIRASYCALETSPLVLGPTDDGGYYLIGVTRPIPGLLTGIAWSSGQELAATVRSARERDLTPSLLPRWWDVDTREDLAGLLDRLDRSGPLDPPSARLRDEVALILAGPPGEAGSDAP